ncbi:MAG: DUF1254 domain-containing protein [Acidobacteria bacterium]|nr:MAG: DUF1254 domain-containing protein [Acidobacteriota bacterium]MCL4286147.1 DUF1254 domain-containing protein [Thermoleophilia bacterium]GIK77879.1 MAG: hypothetical protein BroJett022_15690 [Actinomycetes bacterium]
MSPGRAGWLAAVLATLALAAPVAARAGEAAVTPAEANALGHEAYVYGFPLLDMLRIRREMTSVPCPDGHGNAPLNHIANASRFATPSDRTVVAPNTDTLYSLAQLDLKKGPIVLRHPELGRRFFDFELVDPWTNVIDYVGIRTTGSGAGRFTIRWTGDGRAEKAKRLGHPIIETKYRRVWLIGRTLAGDEADQAKAYELMKRYRLLKPNGRRFRLPAGCHRGKGEPSTHPLPTDGADLIARLNRAMADNPPPKRDRPLLDRLAPLGVGPGLSPADAGLDPDVLAALHRGVEQEQATLPTATRLSFVRQSIDARGWIYADPDIGDFGTDYLLRAQVAVVGIGANTPEEAVYPGALADSDGALLNGASDYEMVFAADDMPPTRYFWSLTMYDLDGFLVANPIDRYSLGPSHPPLVVRDDGSIVVVISHDRPADGDVNWLPAPSGPFRLNMRLYGPRRSVLNGGWTPPAPVRLP